MSPGRQNPNDSFDARCESPYHRFTANDLMIGCGRGRRPLASSACYAGSRTQVVATRILDRELAAASALR